MNFIGLPQQARFFEIGLLVNIINYVNNLKANPEMFETKQICSKTVS